MPRSDARLARNKAVRERLSNISTVKATLPSTQDVVRGECQRLELPLVVKEIPGSGGANLLWIGETSSDKVLFYVHGGCYGLPAMPGHVTFNIETQQKMAVGGKPYALAMLEYKLAPERKYPTQHIQAIQAVQHLLNSGYQPSNIVLAGDSAGGALVLCIMSATAKSKCHPGIPFLEIDSPFRGALLISPWTCFKTDTASWKENLDRDVFTLAFHDKFVKDFLPDRSIPGQQAFVEPCQTNSRWWSHVKVGPILNLAGSDEVFRDHICQMGELLAKAGLNIQTVECVGQIHIECIIDSFTQQEPGSMSEAAWQWLMEVL